MIDFDFQVKRSARRKTVSICVYPDNRVVVSAPYNAGKAHLMQIVEKKSDWIRAKLQANLQRTRTVPERQFKSGEKLLYLGVEYVLLVERGTPDLVTAENGQIRVRLPLDNPSSGNSAVRNRLIRWYAAQALALIKKRVGHFSPLVGASPASVTLKNLKSRWGSCSARGCISLAWNIIMASEQIVDYLVVHELCHLVHHNHSTEYWKLVESILPDHRERRKWLRENGGLLSLE